MRERTAGRTVPFTVAGLAGAYAAVVGVRDPAAGGPFLPCPFHSLTGLWCPTCGATRGVHQLLNGDVAAAVGACAPLIVLLPLFVYGWLTWVVPGLPSLERVSRHTWFAGIAALVAFGVARNLPLGAALAP